MKNFPVQIDGKEYWISRSVAVCGFIFTEDQGLRILAIKRGKGCPDNIGKWCCPCGYIDYDETLLQACMREIKEETDLTVDPSSLNFSHIDSDPKANRQNITISYWSFKSSYAGQTVTGAFADKDEVDDVEWISIGELNKYEWAFNHDCLIMRVALNTLYPMLSKETKRRFKDILKERDFLLNHA